ncbi:S1C family serine protease [Roseobacter sp. HKCCD6544]|uniref:S1C family serine protease n=3 Tax=unclassified Roseobacter TaxID=196798 RepID=UPI0034603B35
MGKGRMMTSSFLVRLWSVTAAVLIVILTWQSIPLLQARLFEQSAEPRLITPRGDLSLAEESTIAVFDAAKDSVVFITTAQRVVDPWTRNAYHVPHGNGSGFVWDVLGHIVTNYHVIEGASSATIRLADGRAFSAQLVGAAPQHDLAVLQVGVGVDRPLPIPIGTSADLRVGQAVLAIGNPFGLDWTLTTGIVSALDREIPGDDGRAIQGLIQIDAAINPGNSGGPLIDSAGRLIGINTAIYSPSGSSAGIGFAVPIDTINRVVPQLVATGSYAPPQLGIRFDPRGDAFLSQAGQEGVLILDVVPNTAAARARLRPTQVTSDGRIALGDVIVSLNGEPIEDSSELQEALDRHSVGETIELGVIREGERIAVSVTLTS